MNLLAKATEDGKINLIVSSKEFYPVSISFAKFLVENLKTAIDQAEEKLIEILKNRPMPTSENFKAKLRVTLRDSYGEVYYDAGATVTVHRRTPAKGIAESCLNFPYQIGGFYVDAAAFDPL